MTTATMNEWPAKVRELNWQAPELAREFSQFFHGLMTKGALTVREKELIALSIALAVQCAPSIHVLTERAARAGASRQQILEAAGVAVVMQGGATYTQLPHALEALDAVTRERHAASVAAPLHVVHSDSD